MTDTPFTSDYVGGGTTDDGVYVYAGVDAKYYGTFSGTSQPKGISGHGSVSKQKLPKSSAYRIVTIDLKDPKTGTPYVLKNVNTWIAEDGSSWVWDERGYRYVMIGEPTQVYTGVNALWR